MIQSKLYRTAKKMSSKTKEEKKVRSETFNAAREKYNLNEYNLHDYVKEIRNSWLGEHIDSLTAQKLATRAFQAANKMLIGKAEKVNFKRYGQLDSMEGKNNKSGIRWKDNKIVWNNLELNAVIDVNDLVIAYGLSCSVKYVRIVKKIIRGKVRFYVQLICEGKPYQKEKNKVIKGKTGLDIGPSTIAEVGDNKAYLDLFCQELGNVHSEIRILQRRMDRQRRANNPDNYNSDKTIKKGKKKWVNSKRYLKTKAKFTELNRCQVEHRKSLHGKMINNILKRGNEIYLENLSYKSFQKNFGKSVNYRAPGMFVNRLKQKVKNIYGKIVEFSTKTTALSQNCHCGKKLKKSLSTRWHKCTCGVSAQRDLYSAFLARHIINESENNYLDKESASKEWPTIKPLLEKAIKEAKNKYWYKAPASFGI